MTNFLEIIITWCLGLGVIGLIFLYVGLFD